MAVGCVGSSANDGDYLSKAEKTIDVVRSSVQTVRLAVQVIDDGGGYDPYLGRLIGQAETDATSAVNSFDVVQPPTRAADAIRDEVDKVTGDAVDVLVAARVNIRRDDEPAVSALAGDLDAAVAALDAFKDAHG